LPCGWEYIRLKTIATLTGGFTPKPEELSSVGTIPYFKVSDMNTPENYKFMVHSSQYYISEASRKTFPKGSIVFPKNGGAVLTNKKRILVQESVVDLNTGVLIPYQPLNIEYLFILFSTIDFNKHHKGSSLPTINTDFMNNIVFGLPPLAEQERIVLQVQSIMQYIELLENNQGDYESLVNTLKKAILQSAIQGTLVEQVEDEEPASILLERIREEKRNQLGKKYVESYIYKGDDNRYYEHIDGNDVDITEKLPFIIPANWSWAHLCDLGVFSSGKTPSMEIEEFWKNGTVEWFSSKDMKQKYLSESQLKITELAAENMTIYPANTLLLVSRSGILKHTLPICILTKEGTINQDIKAYQLYKLSMSDYIFFMLKGLEKIVLEDFAKEGTTVNSLKFEEFSKEMFIPIPPLAEQERIVNKINEIFAQL